MNARSLRRLVAALIATACGAAGSQGIPREQLRSGFDTMGAATRAMQRDDDANPGMLWVRDGEARWSRREGAEGRACVDCHGDARQSMRGVAPRYPAWDATSGRPRDLSQRIEACRERHQRAAPAGPESQERLALSAFVGHVSRGMPLAPDPDPRLDAARERGRVLFERRLGQLSLACSECHDRHWGAKLAGNTIPQGHPNGYPLYRLEWQSLGSLQRRLRNCVTGVRAEPWPADAPEYVELELFLQRRAAGLPLEVPAVRP